MSKKKELKAVLAKWRKASRSKSYRQNVALQRYLDEIILQRGDFPNKNEIRCFIKNFKEGK
jgi:hypothetical protein